MFLDKDRQPVDPERELEIVGVQCVFFEVKAQPKERLQVLSKEIDSTGIRPSRDALQDQKTVLVLNQSLGSCLSHGQESTQHVPAVRSGRQAEVGDGHNVVHMQAAQQLALRIAAMTM